MNDECEHDDDPYCCPVCVGRVYPPTNADRNPGTGDKEAEKAAPKPRRIGPDKSLPDGV